VETGFGEGPVEGFWRNARRHTGLETVPGYFGRSPLELMLPPTWSFGVTPEQADELLELVLTGVKTATASAYADYEAQDEPLPHAGSLSIVLDSRGVPRALLQTTAVEVRAFDEVDAEHAYLEGEGDRTLDYWRRAHRKFFSADRHFDPQMQVVLERFELRYAGE